MPPPTLNSEEPFFGVGDAEVVGVAELAAYAVGAVAHDEGGDVCCGDGA